MKALTDRAPSKGAKEARKSSFAEMKKKAKNKSQQIVRFNPYRIKRVAAPFKRAVGAARVEAGAASPPPLGPHEPTSILGKLAKFFKFTSGKFSYK